MKPALLLAAAALLLAACHHTARLARRAAEGDPVAQCEYGRCLLTGQKGLSAHPERAVAWFRCAAADGYAPAQTMLALCYERGLGVERDEAEARRLYTLAAEQGYTNACRALVAWDIRRGQLPAASRWLRTMAEQENPAAQLFYGKLCLSGQLGQKREEEGVRYLRFAAMQGNAEACRLLADCYACGTGVPQNALLAEGWRQNAQEAS